MNAVLRSRPVCFLLFCLFLPSALLAQQVACPVQSAPTDPAAQALAQRDYPKAIKLYAARVTTNPKDMDAIAGEVRGLLESQQVDAAALFAESNFAAYPKSAVLATALGEVRYRQGRLIDALESYRIALQLDPCLARMRYDLYRILSVESMHASAYAQLQMGHALEPNDPDIHLAWIQTLPLAERSSQIDSYLSAANHAPTEQEQFLQEYASLLRAVLAAKNKNSGCRLASNSATTTTLPFDYVNKDVGNRYHGIGFVVKINKVKALLELDTGSSGILLDRGTAKSAGVIPISDDTISGLGDQKAMNGYWGYADDFHVGKLEFKNCMVEVSNKRSILGIQGLIGADVFENYHVQLDFPLRQMVLSPLPTRPGDEPAHGASLNASGNTEEAASASSGKAAARPKVRYADRYIGPEMQSWSPFARVGHQILINGKLKDGGPRLFLLDSGSERSMLSIRAAKSVGKLHGDYDDRITGLSGEVKNIYTVNKADIVFAGLRDPFQEIMAMNLDGLSRSTGTEVSGIIGLDTLLMLTMDIDYRDGLIHLQYDPKHGMNNLQGFH